MKAVYKYQMAGLRDQWVTLPDGAKILKCDFQNGILCLWALVDQNAMSTARFFKVLGTGWFDEVDDFDFVGTVFQDMFVWHVFVQRLA